MTPELTVDNPIEPPKAAPSTAGMTTKVVKGSIWTLGGSIAPLAVAFISIPFTIRFLGTESYGVLLLVGLIPTYFAFADFGMGVASTKFASEAYGQGDEKKEAEIVWTATAIAAISALLIAVPIFLFSYQIVALLNVPEDLLSRASIALRITSGSFFLGILSAVLNSPMLARLRMDLNMLTSAIPKILLAVGTPLILYFGGGIVEAVSWAFIVAAGTLAVVIYFSASLLPGLLSATFNRHLMRPLLKFGGGWLLAVAAGILVANLEKLFLTQMVSVKALAYYSVAFSVAMMATIFSHAMVQSLVPAFSRLDRATSSAEFERLISRGIRTSILWMLPTLTVMFVAAKPLFTIWAGEDFGTESVLPFYILLASLFFNILAIVPHAAIVAAGRTDVFARVYWFELAVYGVTAAFLVARFEVVGAALAWSLRTILDALFVIALSKRIAGVRFQFWFHLRLLSAGILILACPIFLTLFVESELLIGGLLAACVCAYLVVAWRRFVSVDERYWILGQLRDLLNALR
ncbi:MAG: oligosaccharide flippase family protein [bacterium]|nr:oligosaccharide flippase family protein [bacterium]